MVKRKEPLSISWQGAILLPFCAGLFGMGLSLFLQPDVHAAQVTSEPSSDISSHTSPDEPLGNPDRLVIPAIGVNAKAESVGLSAKGNGELGVPTNFTNVAWYKNGPIPGAAGSAVIDGHLDGRYVEKAVFYRLGELTTGDRVLVETSGGKLLTFKVVGVKTYAYDADASEVFSGDDSKARLNLITCAGDWIKSAGLYDKRVVVFTELVN